MKSAGLSTTGLAHLWRRVQALQAELLLDSLPFGRIPFESEQSAVRELRLRLGAATSFDAPLHVCSKASKTIDGEVTHEAVPEVCVLLKPVACASQDIRSQRLLSVL